MSENDNKKGWNCIYQLIKFLAHPQFSLMDDTIQICALILAMNHQWVAAFILLFFGLCISVAIADKIEKIEKGKDKDER